MLIHHSRPPRSGCHLWHLAAALCPEVRGPLWGNSVAWQALPTSSGPPPAWVEGGHGQGRSKDLTDDGSDSRHAQGPAQLLTCQLLKGMKQDYSVLLSSTSSSS